MVGLAGAATPVGKKVLGGRGFATDVTVSFTAPRGYRIWGSGYENWQGPQWTSLVTGGKGESNLDFDVHPDFTTRSAERAARNKIGTDSGAGPTREVAAGPIALPHRVGGRRIGTIRGFFVIRQTAKKGYEGWFEAGVGLPLGPGYPVLAADVDTTSPDSDSDKRIQGKLPSEWNRAIVEQGVRGIAVEGNLAPQRVIARVLGRRVAGRATDTLGHPLVGATAVLERRSGSAWRRVAATRTTASGGFVFALPGAAAGSSLRVAVSFGGATAKSKPLR